MRIVSILGLMLVATSATFAAEPSRRLPQGVELEQPCPSGDLTKIVFVAGSNFYKPGEHEYIGGCAVLMNLVRQTPGMFPVLALDWPTKPETFADAKAVVFYFDGGEKHALLDEARRKQVQSLVDRGVGIVSLHQGIDVPAELGDTLRSWMGAAFEKGFSQRAHWVTKHEKFAAHPICQGVTPFAIDDGYLFKLRFVEGMTGVTPLLRTVSPKKPVALETRNEDVVAWAFERPAGGRSFTFTGSHLHASLNEEGYRRFLTNGILWSAGVTIPSGGAKVELPTGGIETYLEKDAR